MSASERVGLRDVGVAGLCLMAVGCTAVTAAPVVTSAGAATPVSANFADYRLHAGDVIRVEVLGETALSGTRQIAEGGGIVLPLVGELPASGLTTAELQARIRAAYNDGGFLRSPQVAITIEAYRPFYILGEVNKPGQYPFRPGLSVESAVATAGGYTYRANERRIIIRRSDSGRTEEASGASGTRVLPGDTIRVLERYF